MTKFIVYGLGGYCADCDPTHDHPLHNLVEEWETPDNPTPLDTLGVLATLSAILNPDHVDDYARAVGLTAADLVREAQAWAVASTPSDHS